MGFDIDGQYSALPPPLFIAIQMGHIDVTRLLIHYGCNLENRYVNKTPTEVAFSLGDFDILKILLLCGAKTPMGIWRMFTVRQNAGTQPEGSLWLKDWLQQPPSLKCCCRNTLRRSYGKRLLMIIETIKYPRYLKDYITAKVLI